MKEVADRGAKDEGQGESGDRPVRSRLFVGHVAHARLDPVEHAFSYPVWFCSFDLEELPALQADLSPWFGLNRFRPLSLRDADHLDRKPGSIRQKLAEFLRECGIEDEIGRVELVTSGRYFGYVFNPVSFFFCHRTDGAVRCVVAEVNNTVGERHFYLVDDFKGPDADGSLGARARKEFHVSPFNDREGTYAFAFRKDDRSIDIRVDIERDGKTVFKSQLAGQAVPLTRTALLRTLLSHPLQTWMTFPRILAQAARLYFVRKLAFHSKPVPRSDLTMQTAPPTLGQRLSMKIVLSYFGRMQRGLLRLRLPDRSVRTFGVAGSGPEVRASIRDYRFFNRLLLDGDIGFGESYTAGEWETDDLTGLLELFVRNVDHFDDRDMATTLAGRMVNRLLHLARRNTAAGSRKNIAAHYDLSNEFFSLFLDPTMLYSCALFRADHETLEQAQRNKLQALIAKARIGPEDHVLEIGTGWGAFAIEAVRRTGCRVTTVTISQQQWEMASRRVRDAGLEDRITVLLQDYRALQGQYDRIVSIEMLEAVGHEYLGEFFRVCDRLLKPKGLVVLQVITIPDQRYEAYRRGTDWIQKHIFPGGHLPSLQALADAMASHSGFMVEQLENVGPHYARTLKAWRERFIASVDDVRRLGFDDAFLRKWTYYLAYCEAGFAARHINTLHLVLTRPNNETLDRSAPAAVRAGQPLPDPAAGWPMPGAALRSA